MSNRVLANLDSQIKIIKDAREEYYGENGLMKNAYYGNLVGTPGGVYQEGMVEADLSYKKVFEKLYDTGTALPIPKKPRKAPSTQMTAEAEMLSDSVELVNGNCKIG